MQRIAIAAFLLASLWSNLASAQWGTLKGRVVLEGEAPEIPPLVNGPARGVAGDVLVPDDSLVIDPETKGVANIAVWLVKKPEKINDDLLEALPEVVTLETVGLRFEPHLLVVHTSQKIDLVNQDLVAHNAHSSPIRNSGFNLLLAPKKVNPLMQLKEPEKVPVQVVCDIYPWMHAYLIVVDHPYATVTDTDGTFTIPDLPVGEHEFKIWHERAGYLVKDAVNPKKGLIVKVQDGKPTVVPDIKVTGKTLTEPRK